MLTTNLSTIKWNMQKHRILSIQHILVCGVNIKIFGPLIDPLKISENQIFSDVFRGYRNVPCISISSLYTKIYCLVNSSRPDPRQRGKKNLNFHFHTSLWCLKCFMKAFKVFIKPSEAPQRSVKIKNSVNFYSNTTFWNARDGKGLNL